MKKIYLIAACFALSLMIAQGAYALTFDTSGGEAIAMDTADPAFDPFTPSTNVSMKGRTAVAGFAISAVHDQVLAKKAGKLFGMASDSSAVFWKDVADTGDTFDDIDTSDSSVFDRGTGNWDKM